MLLELRKKDLNEYERTVEYLINDIYNWQIRADIKQELLLFLMNLIIKIEETDGYIENIDNYIFMCLKNKRNALLKSKQYKRNDKFITIDDVNSIPDYKGDNCDLKNEILDNLNQIIEKYLTDEEQNIIRSYYYENKKMTEIGQVLGVSQQAISKRIKAIVKKLRFALMGKYPDLIDLLKLDITK